jgi:hypothetical protein
MFQVQDTLFWKAGNLAVWIVGTALLAVHVLTLLIYGPSTRETQEEAARLSTAADHQEVCGNLGRLPDTAEHEACM